MHHKEKKESVKMEGETHDDYECCCGERSGYCCLGTCECGCGCDCGPIAYNMSKEDAEMMLTKVATDVWMELFEEACVKEWKRQFGKQIQKKAAEHVKKAKKEWDAMVK